MEVLKDFLLFYGGLFAITNPIGAVPVFIAVTRNLSPEKRKEIARKTTTTVTLTLLVFALVGEWIFKFFGASTDAFSIAGGIILFRMSLEMLSGKISSIKISEEEHLSEEAVTLEEIAIIPLAIPLLSGPGAITTTMLYMAKSPTMAEKSIVLLVIVAIGITVWIVLSAANKIHQKLGTIGIKVITRMMGLILASMAVQMVINGVKGAFNI
ncbi:neutral amino acid NAAT transporter SnatA [Pyrococcus woesei]|uniref:neutral amino acid NAAT transporter SnatA n=1 Tax=Pyrococcus woesei TaxID=2262 RepID=UPI003D2EF0EB